MASTNFINRVTPINAEWLNEVDESVYNGQLEDGTPNAAIDKYVPAGTGAVATNVQSKLRETVSVKDFGAKIDGVTDDTAALVAAVATGKNVYVPRGTGNLIITSGITLASAQHLYGDGSNVSVIQVNGNGYDAVTLSSSFAGVRDISFTAPAARTTAHAYVKLTEATTGNFVMRCTMTSYFYGIWVAADAVINVFEDVQFNLGAPTQGVGILIDGGNDTFINRVVMNTSGAQPQCGVRIKHSQAIWMTDCDMIQQGRGIEVVPDGSVADVVTWCFFQDVACDLGAGDGLYVAPTNSAIVKGLFFDNCWFSSNLNGINLDKGASTIEGVYFDGCQVFNNRHRGAWVQAANNTEFNNCRVSGNSQAASGTYPGVEFIDGTNNFAVRGTRSGAVAGFAASQSVGVLIGAGCDSYMLTDNNLTGNISGGVTDGSVGTSTTREVRGNLGYKTVASGTATIVAGQNVTSVTHGLAGAPTVAIATPTNTNLGASSPWWTGSLGVSTFNINVAANVSSNAIFSWQASLYN